MVGFDKGKLQAERNVTRYMLEHRGIVFRSCRGAHERLYTNMTIKSIHYRQ